MRYTGERHGHCTVRTAYSEQVQSTTRVLIVRHAESTFNAEKRYQGREDSAVLTAKGLEAAAAVGRRLAGEPIGVIVTSPLRRARQTAELMRSALRGTPVIEDPNLMEVDLPEWEGLPIETVRRDFAEAYRLWQQHPEAFRMLRNGSTVFYPVRELYAQAATFWSECLKRHSGQSVLLVTHGGTARALLSTALGIDQAHFNSMEQAHGAISVIEFAAGQRQAVVETMNATAHLGRLLPKLKAGKSGVRLVLLTESRGEDALGGMRIDAVLSEAPTREKLLRESKRAGASNAVWRGSASAVEAYISPLLGIEPGWWKDPRDAVVHFPAADRAALVQALNTLA